MKTKSPYSLFGDVGNGNYTEIDPMTGLLKFKGLARPFVGAMKSLTELKQTATSKPDYDHTNLGFLFPINDATELLTGVYCMGMDYAEGSDLYPRLQWHQDEATAATWKIDYRWYDPGAAVPTAFTTVTVASQQFTYIQGNIHQVSIFNAISGTNRKVGSVLQIKLYRDDNTVTGDVLAVAFGLYKRIDALGSQTNVLKSVPRTLVSSSPSSSASSSPSSSASSSPSSSVSSSPSSSVSSSPSSSVSSSPSSSASSSPSSSVSSSPSSSASSSPSAS